MKSALARGVVCPECQIVVTVPIATEIVNGDQAHEGKAEFVCTPDLTDLWAHMWTHESSEEVSAE